MEVIFFVIYAGLKVKLFISKETSFHLIQTLDLLETSAVRTTSYIIDVGHVFVESAISYLDRSCIPLYVQNKSLIISCIITKRKTHKPFECWILYYLKL